MPGLNQFGLDADAFASFVPGEPNDSGGSAGSGGQVQTLTYHLHLDTPAVVTSTGPATLLWVLVEAGPYDVLILPSDGLPHSDFTVTAQAIPDPVPGLLVGAATALFPVLVDGIAKKLSVILGLSNGQPDAILTLGASLGDIQANPSDTVAASILWGGEGYIHVLTSVKSSTDGSPVDYQSLPPRLVVVRGQPADSDYADGDWLTRTAAPAGTYARLYVEGLVHGSYYVYVQITVGGQTITRRAPGTLIVR